MRTDEESVRPRNANAPAKHASCTKKVQPAKARGNQRGVLIRRIGQQEATHGARTATGEFEGRIRGTSVGANGVEYDASSVQLFVRGPGGANPENILRTGCLRAAPVGVSMAFSEWSRMSRYNHG
jgi:hypothetical protein